MGEVFTSLCGKKTTGWGNRMTIMRYILPMLAGSAIG